MEADEVDNTTDPVEDPRFPNIVPFSPEHDLAEDDEHGGCITKSVEEVHPNGS